MAAVMSAKRPRAFTSGRDFGGISRSGPSKRPRHSLPDDDESEAPSIREQSDTHDDSEAALSDEEDEAANEERFARATQSFRKAREKNLIKENKATEAGIIQQIDCVNFMCHERLTVPLGPLINFIIGHNGSGKSAVLTALTICLGGKATATNRAQNLKSLIKEGKEYSSVTVKIKNEGELAYKPSQFGTSIIVERHFSKSGASGFKLRDQNGKVVSTKKSELEDILDAFAMQIDNPMNVLTQDMARQFLNHSTPKDKYKFFLQGTQLEVLNRDYQQIEQSLETMNSKFLVKEEDLGVLRTRMEELVKKARRAENLERMRAKETVIAHQAAWARVQQEETELQSHEAEVQRISDLIEERQRNVEKASEAFDRSDQAYEAAKQSVEDLKPELENAQEQEAEAKETKKKAKEKVLSVQADERRLGEDHKRKKAEIKGLEEEIEQLRQRQAEADNGIYNSKLEEIDEAKNALERAKEAYQNHGTSYTEVDEEFKTLQQEQRTVDQKLNQSRADERRVREQIRGLQQGDRNWMDPYPNPQSLARLMRAIENEQNFREKPVGPIGRHVKLLKPQWGYILEKQFGSALNGFVVTSKTDQNVLSGLMKKHNYNMPIFIGRSAPIDTSQHEPDQDLLTWMRALKIDNHLVRNQLIINQMIDQTVLIENREEGQRFMGTAGPRRRNVKMCFTFADGNQRKGRVLNLTGSGATNNSPIDEYKGALRMQADKEQQIRTEQTRLQDMQREIEDLDQSCQAVLERVNVCRGRIQDRTTLKKQLKLDFQQAQEHVDQLESELGEAAPDSGAIDVRQDMLKEAEKELEHLVSQYEDMAASKKRYQAEANACHRALQALAVTREDFEFKLNKAHGMVRTLQGQREDNLRQKNQSIAQVAAAEENKKLWEEEVRKAKEEVATVTDDARRICPNRVDVPRGANSDALIETLQRLIATRRESERALGGSQDELLRQANEAKRAHQDAMNEFEDIRSLRDHLIHTLSNRRARWKRFRDGISMRARVNFNYLLSERKFRGSLSINHTQGLLDIHVQPDITESSADGRQTKTLSGGEKSYSTVCLLLSLWEAMGSPIRCLDEFDVFMDSVNRERSMHMIIQAARRSIGRQFIFITPQSMGNVQRKTDVRIFKMPDPERGQTTL